MGEIFSAFPAAYSAAISFHMHMRRRTQLCSDLISGFYKLTSEVVMKITVNIGRVGPARSGTAAPHLERDHYLVFV